LKKAQLTLGLVPVFLYAMSRRIHCNSETAWPPVI
jgi:hypothetical protein